MSNTQVPDDTMAFVRILTSMEISKWIVFTDVVIRDHMGWIRTFSLVKILMRVCKLIEACLCACS